MTTYEKQASQFATKTVAAMANREDAKRPLRYFVRSIQNKTHVLTKNDF